MLRPVGEGTHWMAVVYVVVGDEIICLPQIDEQTETSVGFPVCEHWAGVVTERKCCGDAVVVPQCQLYS